MEQDPACCRQLACTFPGFNAFLFKLIVREDVAAVAECLVATTVLSVMDSTSWT